ncbi:MAG: hypothetical protein HOY78_26125 [Saccharothrix sp.]|nr:hypothetical protein [Saccharothrix sp.]
MTLDHLADRFDTWSRYPEAAADVLTGLGEDLRAGGHALVGSPLVQAYPPEVLLPDLARPAWVGWIEVVRDLLVFVPVGFTWWRLSDALEAHEKANSTESFLLGWQRGFGGQVASLGSTAAFVAFTVLLIIGLTLAAHLLNHRSAASRTASRAALAQDLALATVLVGRVEVAGEVQLTKRQVRDFAARIGASNSALVGALKDTGDTIAGAVRTGPGSHLHSALSEWTEAARALKDMGSALQAPAETLAALIALHETVVSDGRVLQGSLTSLVDQLDQATQRAEADAQSHREVAGEVARSAERLGESLDVFRERTESLSELVAQLRYALDRMDHRYDGWDEVPLDNARPLGDR